VNGRRLPVFLVLLVAVAGLTGCGAGSGNGKARVWITRDQGATLLERGTVPAGLTALQGLDRLAKVETGYGGAFVTAIDGLGNSQLRQRDWFYFVNGYESDRGAASYRLRAGDVEWWDYRAWRGREHVPVAVGAFPEPFLHGYDGKRRPAAVRFQLGLRSEALALARVVRARSVAPLGVAVAPARTCSSSAQEGRALWPGSGVASGPAIQSGSCSAARTSPARSPATGHLFATATQATP